MPGPESFLVRIPDGVKIRDPLTGRIACTGEEYPRSGFWARRLAAGEVTELEPDTQDKAARAAEQTP